jgi:hypothetical protein
MFLAFRLKYSLITAFMSFISFQIAMRKRGGQPDKLREPQLGGQLGQ